MEGKRAKFMKLARETWKQVDLVSLIVWRKIFQLRGSRFGVIGLGLFGRSIRSVEACNSGVSSFRFDLLDD